MPTDDPTAREAAYSATPVVPDPADASYFERRAEEQIRLATRSTEPRAVQAHYDLATLYLERIHGAGENEDDPPERDEAA